MNAVERLQLAQVVDYCAKWLKANGIKVLRVEGNTDQPRLIVKHNAMCERFEGIVRAYERSDRGAHYCAWVYRYGCQIKWVEPAPNPHKVEVTA
ncbi:MAG: hypothetical protein AB1722_12415 [Pseudomonadota bacterium]